MPKLGQMALIGAFYATSALAEQLPSAIYQIGGGGDSVELRWSGPFIEVLYNNAGGQSSREAEFALELDGVILDISINIGTPLTGQDDGEEVMTVTPRDAGLIAVPAEAEARDGEFAAVLVMPPIF